jgi:hypothetical protein
MTKMDCIDETSTAGEPGEPADGPGDSVLELLCARAVSESNASEKRAAENATLRQNNQWMRGIIKLN